MYLNIIKYNDTIVKYNIVNLIVSRLLDKIKIDHSLSFVWGREYSYYISLQILKLKLIV